MSISSLETDARLDPATSGPNGVFRKLKVIRRVRHRLTRELLFTFLRRHGRKPGMAFIGATALGKSSIDRDIVTLVVIIVAVAGSFWFGQASRETLGGCTTNPPSMEFVPELNVAMTVKSGVGCAIWARVMTTFVDTLDVVTPPRHGTLRTRGLSGVIYRPDKDYVGEDAFAFVRQGASQYHKGVSLVRVEVSVE
jgi:hypothetical protein